MLTQELAAYLVTPINPSEIEAARRAVRGAFLDTTGCIVAGRRHGATESAAQWAQGGFPSGEQASVLFSTERASVRGAAFVNAVSAHAWELDDAAFASHPSCVLVPAILAQAEDSAHAGDRVVAAYARAYQIWGELNRRSTRLHDRGWHPTSVFGPVAVAAAIASLRGLDETRIAHSLGIAASLAGGVTANFGTATKPIQVGLAAERGIMAVDLAEAGIASAAGALDGRGGLLEALDGHAGGSSSSLTQGELEILTAPPTVKKYPVCLASHRVIDGLLDLRASVRGEVRAVEATISESSAAVLERGQNGPLGIAQFSLPFAVASALIHGRLGLAEVSPELVDDPAVRGLMDRVQVVTTTSQSPEEPSFAVADRVVVVNEDGRRWDSGEIRHVRGNAAHPLHPGELEQKVQACLDFGEPDDDRARAIIAAVEALITPHARGEDDD